jgi:hypothetical protein
MAKEIKNYLKSVKDITAPLNWKSSPDSPKTQLAYVTQPEIDMLVKANIHGSMNGKPNMGPKGIISLDGMGAYDEDSVVSNNDQKKYEAATSGSQGGAGGTSQSSYDTGKPIPTKFKKQYQMEQDQDKPIPGVSFGDEMGVTLTPEEAKKVKEETSEEEKSSIKEVFDFFSKFSPLKAVGTGFGTFIKKLIVEPKAKQFTNPNDLAIIRSLFTDGKGEIDTNKLDDYYDQYKVTIGEGLTSDKASGEAAKFFEEQGIVDNEKVFQDFKNAIMGASPTGVEGMESERRLDPVGFFTNEDGSFNIPQTSGQATTMAESLTFDDIMNSSLSGPEKRRLGAALMEARELASQDRGVMGTSVAGSYNLPATTPPATTPPATTDPNPTLPITTPQIPTPKFPDSVVRDYTQLGLPNIYGNQQMPNYANFYQGQGTQPIGIKNYLDALRNRFGIG